jgi:hypothetical protein
MAYHLFKKNQKVVIDLGFGDTANATVVRSDVASVLVRWADSGRQTWINASLLRPRDA